MRQMPVPLLPLEAKNAVRKMYRAGYRNMARMVAYLAIPHDNQFLQSLRFTCQVVVDGKPEAVRFSYQRREPYGVSAYIESAEEFFSLSDAMQRGIDSAMEDILSHLKEGKNLTLPYTVWSVGFNTKAEVDKEEYPKVHLQAVILELISFFEENGYQNLADLTMDLATRSENTILIGYLAEPSDKIKSLPLNDPYLVGIYQGVLTAAVIFGDYEAGLLPVESLLLLRESFGQYSQVHRSQFEQAAAIMLWYLQHPKTERPGHLGTGRVLHIQKKLSQREKK